MTCMIPFMYIKLPFTFMGLTHIITPVHFKVSQGSIQGTILSSVVFIKALYFQSNYISLSVRINPKLVSRYILKGKTLKINYGFNRKGT